jgi:hypothetical protein
MTQHCACGIPPHPGLARMIFFKGDLMKTKSFLFLTAALAMGLTLAGCPGEATTETKTVYRGVASDAEAIMAAFEVPGVNEVYLAKETDLTNAVLVIPANKTLYVNGQTVNVNEHTVIAAAGKLNWGGLKSDAAATSKIAAAGTATLVNIPVTADEVDLHYAWDGEAGTGLVSFVPADGSVVGTGKYSKAGYADTAALVLGGSYLAVSPGTTGYLINGYNDSGKDFEVGGGTLVVAGNLTAKTINVPTSSLTVYGELTAGTSASADVISGGGTVSARTVAITGGNIKNELFVVNSGEFGAVSGGTLVTFTGTLSAGTATISFLKDVEFTAPSKVGATTFANGITVGGNLQVEDTATTGNSLIISGGGQIILAGDKGGKFLPGTLATVGAAAVTLDLSDNDTFETSGAGTFSIPAAIDLGENTIVFGNTGGLYFAAAGSIAAESYVLGDFAGTLSNSSPGGSAVTLTKDGITGANATLKFSTAGTFLVINNGSLTTVSGVNIDLATAGTITFEPSATLILASGGSITTAGGSLAHGGRIASIPSGSIVSGDSGSVSKASVDAGSIGTIGQNFINSKNNFARGDGTASVAVGSAASNPLAQAGGSIAVFEY